MDRTRDIDVLCELFPAPSQAPGDVSAGAISATSLSVSWRGIPDGETVTYNVYFSLADAQNDFRVQPAGESNNTEIGDLGVYTLYVIRVAAENAAGKGPRSAPVQVRTLEGGIKSNN